MRRRLLSALLPRRCAYCGRVVPADVPACADCIKALPRITGVCCPQCGRAQENCTCRTGARYFDRLAAPYYYEGLVRLGLHRFKFRGAPGNAAAYAQAMAATVRSRYGTQMPDCVAAVPMTARARRARGYDQTQLLAEGVAAALGLPCLPLLTKVYETQKQHGLNAWRRRGNLIGAFDVPDRAAPAGRHVLLVDDISTSGETLNECAKMLWLCDAAAVSCVTLALTRENRKQQPL